MGIWADGLQAPKPMVSIYDTGAYFSAPLPILSSGTLDAAITAPKPTVNIERQVYFYSFLGAPLPTLSVGYGNELKVSAAMPSVAMRSDVSYLAVTAPMPLLFNPFAFDVTAPKPIVVARSDGGSVIVSAPMPMMSGASGWSASLSAPLPLLFSTVIASGTVITTENPYGLTYPGWAINYETNAPSRYEGLPANSMCHFNGVTYVANAGGIYALNAADDAGQPIHASITLPKTDYGDSKNKRVPSAFVGIRSSGQMQLKAVTNNLSGLFYTINPTDANMRSTRVKMGDGIDGRYWTFRLSNTSGADFEVDSMEFNPIILKRHGV